MFCGSREGNDPAYMHAARSLGTALAARNIGLVYGGASVGLMGAVADAALAAGGRVIGVIPQALVDREVAHHGLSELRVVATMHDRKATMAELSDAFVALPGGLGTFEELFEVWTWAMLGYHQKPCALLDVAGYYDKLASFLDDSVARGFVDQRYRDLLVTADSAESLLDALAAPLSR